MVVNVLLQRIGQTGRGVLDLGDFQLGDVLVLAGDAEVLDDLIGLLCERLVYSDCVFGIWF